MQRTILSSFQVFNAPSWLAVFVAAFAAYAAFEQADVARMDRVDAQRAREEAVQAFEAAERAGQGAKQARDNPETAQESIKKAFEEMATVRDAIQDEATAFRLLQVKAISARIGHVGRLIRISCPHSLGIECRPAVDEAGYILDEATSTLVLYSDVSLDLDSLESAYCGLEGLFRTYDKAVQRAPVCEDGVFQTDLARALHIRNMQ